MSHFDDIARTWDINPVHLERSIAIAAKLNEKIPLNKQMIALEYGAGTGILSILLAGSLGQIIMMDNSVEMVRVMKEKMLHQKITNLFPVQFNLELEPYEQKVNLIFNQMVLHHISDIEAIFSRFYDMILPGGSLAIADLYTEDGSFHGDGFNGHLGFDPGDLSQRLQNTGFSAIQYEPCFSMIKETSTGKYKSFPIFLLTALK